MKPGEASRTAEFNALFRAIESSRRPRGKRLFEDPLASRFLGRLHKAYLLSRLPLIGRLVPLYIDRKWPGVRPAHLGRTCWIDDQLADALREGVSQVVVLGSGYDCRAYRLPGLEDCRVFEIDHPDTLAIKIDRLRKTKAASPSHVSFLAADLAKEDLASILDKSSFDRSMAAFFLLEGLLHYLDEATVDALLRSMDSVSAPGSRLAFTYVHRGLLDSSVTFGEMGRVPETLSRSGENWTFGIYPEELAAYLADRGFALLSDIGSVEYRALYTGSSGRYLKGFEFYRAALASKARE